MRIVCPACEATYDVPDRLIGAGRSLRCRKCAHEWLVQPPADLVPGVAGPAAPSPLGPLPLVQSPLAQSPLAQSPLAQPPPDHPPAPPALLADPTLSSPDFDPWPVPATATQHPISLRAAWAASILLVAGLALALWVFRAEVAQAWPPAARLFQLLGGATVG